MKKVLLASVLFLTTGVVRAQETLFLMVSGGSVSFDLSGHADSMPTVTLMWNVSGTAGEHAWIVYPYFQSSTALAGTYNRQNTIATGNVSLSVGSASLPCIGSGIYGGGYSNPLSASNNCPAIFYHNDPSATFSSGIPLSGSQTTTIMPSVSVPSRQNADNYTGTLQLVAYVE